MYTNIDTKIGLQSFQSFLELNKDLIPNNFPTNLFLTILETVMSNNIFSFGDTKWLQLSGTAMGTSAACAYATIAYGHHKNTEILTKFAPNLLYYRRYIDDIFGVWVLPESHQTAIWKNFECKLNEWGSLEWIIEEPSNKTVFLDLNIELINSKNADEHLPNIAQPVLISPTKICPPPKLP